LAGTTGLEPATSAVTGQRSNQLSYVPNVAHVHRDPAHALQQMVGDGRQLLRGDAERRPGDAHRRHRQPLRIQHRHGDAAQALFKLLVVDGVAAAAGLFDLRAQCLGRGDGAVRKALEADAAQNVGGALLGAGNARIALPTEVQCTGLLAPMRVIMRTERAGSILSM
jgi:hypothetical protein